MIRICTEDELRLRDELLQNLAIQQNSQVVSGTCFAQLSNGRNPNEKPRKAKPNFKAMLEREQEKLIAEEQGRHR